MCLIEGVERTLDERTRLRAELRDYLIDRLHRAWMIDILSVTQELNAEDVKLERSDDIQIGQELTPHPDAFEAAAAAIACDERNALGIHTL